MEINRKQIMETFLSILDNISDKEYQERVWIRGEGPECDDFTETVCHFGQEGDAIIEECNEFGITPVQLNILMRFRDVFSTFPRKYDLPEEFINSSEWESVVMMAKEVLKAFNYTRHA